MDQQEVFSRRRMERRGLIHTRRLRLRIVFQDIKNEKKQLSRRTIRYRKNRQTFSHQETPCWKLGVSIRKRIPPASCSIYPSYPSRDQVSPFGSLAHLSSLSRGQLLPLLGEPQSRLLLSIL